MARAKSWWRGRLKENLIFTRIWNLIWQLQFHCRDQQIIYSGDPNSGTIWILEFLVSGIQEWFPFENQTCLETGQNDQFPNGVRYSEPPCTWPWWGVASTTFWQPDVGGHRRMHRRSFRREQSRKRRRKGATLSVRSAPARRKAGRTIFPNGRNHETTNYWNKKHLSF